MEYLIEFIAYHIYIHIYIITYIYIHSHIYVSLYPHLIHRYIYIRCLSYLYIYIYIYLLSHPETLSVIGSTRCRPISSCGLRLDDEAVRVATGFRLVHTPLRRAKLQLWRNGQTAWVPMVTRSDCFNRLGILFGNWVPNVQRNELIKYDIWNILWNIFKFYAWLFCLSQNFALIALLESEHLSSMTIILCISNVLSFK